MTRFALGVFTSIALASAVACGDSTDASEVADDGEPADEAAITTVDDPDETATGGDATPLAATSEFVDVRGVGDSAWTKTHVSPAPAARFGAALDAFDRAQERYRGHVNFMNWESVIADACEKFSKPYEAGRSYAFVSRAENVSQAIHRGFNLIGLANNHTRDCTRTPEGIDGVESTRRAREALESPEALFAGVSKDSDKRKPTLGTFDIGGRKVRVAFASIYLGIASGEGVTCAGDADAVMTAMKTADVDLRILAMHSVDDRNQAELAKLGERFVTQFGGDIVFGSGPHVWRPVRVLRKPNGKAGVVFESLGNFLDPALAAQPKNFVGRALLDRATLRLAQVQLIAIENRGEAVLPSSADPSAVAANLRWQKAPASFGAPVVYANVKP